jgi:hypothetical protein
MPAGRQILSTENGPPGGNPGGLTQRVHHHIGQSFNRLSIGHRMHEKHNYTQLSKLSIGNTCTLSTGISVYQSVRLTHRKSMRERPDAPPTLYTSRTRFPANQLDQQRDLRHGCQGLITINNPIMED